ncbi:MAG: alanine racemase [Bacteroidota bacterium]
MRKNQETVLEINLDALEHNYRYLRSRIKPSTKFLAVVKAFAYGSAANAVAKKLEALGVDYFAVAYAKEGVALRKAGVKAPIMVLHPQMGNCREIVEHCLEPCLYSLRILEGFLKTAKSAGQRAYPVHLKFNTGLNRLGFGGKDIKAIKEHAKRCPQIQIRSVFSHLAASDDKNEATFTHGQIHSFQKLAVQLNQALDQAPFRHILNTSGIINYPEFQMDMVRSGIGLYGFGNDIGVDAALRPVASLKTTISQMHTISAQETVGYNRAFTAKEKRTTATLPLGHADGIGRQYGQGKTYVRVNGSLVPIVGNVCMDMLMIDITGVDCKEGDEVTVFGEKPTAEEFAATAGTISYELLTGISQRVKRRVIDK